MHRYGMDEWKRIPVLRLLAGFIAGILLQYYCGLTLPVLYTILFLASLLFTVSRLLPSLKRFQYNWVGGVAICIALIAVGGIISYTQNADHYRNPISKYYSTHQPVLLTLQEPLIAKEKTYKALASVEAVLINSQWQPVTGDVLVYFKKEEEPLVGYGSQIITRTALQPISNSGNPGAFDYRQYCALQGIQYQLLLSSRDYLLLPGTHTSFFNRWLIGARNATLSILRKYIHGNNELSIAEALLIGYRDDLDKGLVQAYSNTGVVHIIAISGLHLAMIYGLLIALFSPFKTSRWLLILKPVVIITVLWGFTCIAGAAPSILRSAVMFTFIVLGESIGKRTNIYHSLAASAFVILLFNPFSLWDVGFQLSYAAVLSIVVFSKSIRNWFYFENKLLNGLWQLNAVTLSAQVFTLPILLYYFHQLPVLFITTNLVVVPLSGFILYGELLLLVTGFIPYIGVWTGKATTGLLWLMNDFIQRVNYLPFAVWGSIQVTILQTIVLYAAVIALSVWLLFEKKKGFLAGLFFIVLFLGIRCYDFIQHTRQQQLIVYNIAQHTSIDLLDGRSCQFIGDSLVKKEGFLYNFHIKPARTLYRVSKTDSLVHIHYRGNLITSFHKNILIIDKSVRIRRNTEKIKVDAIIITGNPVLYLTALAQVFDCKQYVVDGSNPLWKINKWKKEADSLHLQLHSTPGQGAFIMKL